MSLLSWLAMAPPHGGGAGDRLSATGHRQIKSSDLQSPASLTQGSADGTERREYPRAASPQPAASTLRSLGIAGLAVLIVQIALGGWTSSNYAALACPDFPTCQNALWPDMDAKDAFVLWRGLGIDYEGGVLDHPARVAIHFVHRLGAIATALVLGLLAFMAWRRGATPATRTAGALLALVLIAQLILGPTMVIRALPLPLATAHNAVAALLLLAVVRLYRTLRTG